MCRGRAGPVARLALDYVIEGRRTPEQLRLLADTVQEVVLDVFAAPPGDRYQVLTEHRPGQLTCEDTGLGIERTDDLVVLQVFQQGRSEEQKRSLDAGLSPSDLVVSVATNTREDWPFGRGRAQFLDGDL